MDTVTGRITDQESTLTTVSKWQITTAALRNHHYIFSERDFLANNAQWYLTLSFDEDRDICFEVKLFNAGKNRSATAMFKFYALDASDNQFGSLVTELKYFSVGRTFKFHTKINYEDIFNESNRLLVNNKLKVAVEMTSTYAKLSNETSVNFDGIYKETSVSLEGLFNKERFSDVKFVIEGKNLYGHKNILANKSPVFSAMFEHNMKENIENVVELNDFSYEILFEMFRCIYTGRVENMPNVAKELLVAADKYDLVDLKLMCSDFLYRSLSIDNVLELLKYAVEYNVEVLESQVIDFILANTKDMIEVPKLNDILSVPSDVLLKIIRGLMLNHKN